MTRVTSRLAVAGAAAVLTLTLAQPTVHAAPPPPPTPEVVPSVVVSPTAVTPPATTSATASFQVPGLGALYVKVSVILQIQGSDGTSTLSTSSIVTSPGLTNCALVSPRAYQCDVADISAGGTYSIAATIDVVDAPGAQYPVAASVEAAWSWRGVSDVENVQGPTRDAKTLTISAPSAPTTAPTTTVAGGGGPTSGLPATGSRDARSGLLSAALLVGVGALVVLVTRRAVRRDDI